MSSETRVREWWEYSRAEFSQEDAHKHANAQARYRREICKWQERGQLDLFSGEPTQSVDELITLMGL
ncbi:hypothetical protein ABZW10_28490 [Kitasatospora sp. NPDC004723]|uniref:hypothetical protein n=1 Tax=Kitasatospora sp. NPDC004723 TaxID=3154288 RepID=UPI0033BB6F3B